DLADSVVSGVRDVEIAVRRQEDVLHRFESRARGGPAVAGEPRASVAGDGRDDPGGGRDLSDDVVVRVREVDVAVRSDHDAGRPAQGGRRRGPAVAGRARGARARVGGDAALAELDLDLPE